METIEEEKQFQMERDETFYQLLVEIKMLLVDIRRNTGRQISPS